MRQKKGFTLTEIVIAIGILGFVIISVLAVFTGGLNALKKGDLQAVAARMAESKVAQMELLCVKCPQYNRDVRYEVDDVITGKNVKITTPASGDVYIWHYPSDPTYFEIEGEENFEGGGLFKFKIVVTDFEGPTYDYDIKSVRVTVTCPDPPLEVKTTSIIAFGIQ